MSGSKIKGSKKLELDLSGFKGARIAAFPNIFAPMLASPSKDLATHDGWICEPKMDGIRGICCVRAGKTTILSRRGLDLTSQYPVLAATLARLCPIDVVLDGEIIALNEIGKPSFQHLQQRMNLAKEADVERAEKKVPVQYFVFDIVYAGNANLSGVPLRDRKLILNALLSDDSQVRILQYFDSDTRLAYETCVEHGFEGIVAKRLDSLYESGKRSPSWLKVKAQQTDEFVVGGFTAGQGSRGPTFGALLLGQFDDRDRFVYCGSVGSGFDERLLNLVMRKLTPLHIKKCPFIKRPDEKKLVVWTEPQIVIEAKFMDWTRDRHLRTPVFLRFREDKAPHEVRQQLLATAQEWPMPVKNSILESVAEAKTYSEVQVLISTLSEGNAQDFADNDALAHQAEMEKILGQLSGTEVGLELLVLGEKIKLTHLDRPFWPKTSQSPDITKRDYLTFLTKLSPFILPQLSGRPLTCIRATDGIHKKHFYQKHWGYSLPEFVDTASVTQDGEDEAVEHVLCNNIAALLYFAQHSVVEFHCMPARLQLLPDLTDRDTADSDSQFLLNYPDYMIFDLDFHTGERGAKNPSITSDDFKKVCEVALKLREICQSMSLDPSVKTSGRTGLHVLIPIMRNLEFDIVRTLAETIGRFLVSQQMQVLTQVPTVAKTSGKILLDHSPNARGKTVAAAYTPRATASATVSTPVSWDELAACSASHYTIHNLLGRLTDTGDIWVDLHMQKRDLQLVLGSISRP